jgi:hypothetical protein
MKSPAVGSYKISLQILLPLVAGTLAALSTLSGCTPGTRSEASKTIVQEQPGIKLEELQTPVPDEFADAKSWNKNQICPEGSVLTPFTRYTYQPGDNSHGFKHYYGRGCTIVRANEPELSGRGLASAGPGVSISLLPHGPYIWWYETGAKMEDGTFENGTLALGSLQYEPDGSPSTED